MKSGITTSALIFVLVALVGFIISRSYERSAQTAGITRNDSVEASDTTFPSTALEELDTAKRDNRQPMSTSVEPSPPRSGPSDPTQTAPNPDKHTGSIRGTVRDESGMPIAGATIRAEVGMEPGTLMALAYKRFVKAPGELGGGAPTKLTRSRALQDAGREFDIQQALVIETQTDHSGEYVLGPLEDRTWSLSAYLEGHTVKPTQLASQIPIDVSIDFVAKAVYMVEVEVLRSDGQTPQDVHIDIRDVAASRTRSIVRWTHSERFIRLAKGRHVLQAETWQDDSPEPAGWRSEKVELEVRDESQPAKVSLILEPQTSLWGWVQTSNGEPLPNRVSLHLMRLEEGQDVDLQKLKDPMQKNGQREGALFRFFDLEPGLYAVGLCRSYESPIIAHAVVELVGGRQRQDLTLPPQETGESIRIRVRNAAGEILNDISSSLRVEVPNDTGMRSFWPQEGADGWYEVYLGPIELSVHSNVRSDISRLFLTVISSKVGSKTIEILQGVTEVEIQLDTPATLAANLIGAIGSEYHGRFMVELKHLDPPARDRFSEDHMREDGSIFFDALPPGRYELKVSIKTAISGHGYRPRAVAIQEIELRRATTQSGSQSPSWLISQWFAPRSWLDKRYSHGPRKGASSG